MQRGALPRAQRLHPDDPRLDAVWKKAAELTIPANVHIADHPSCWKPLGPNQEPTPDFPHFNLYGKDVLSYEELLVRRDLASAANRAARHGSSRAIRTGCYSARTWSAHRRCIARGGGCLRQRTSICRTASGGATTGWRVLEIWYRGNARRVLNWE